MNMCNESMVYLTKVFSDVAVKSCPLMSQLIAGPDDFPTNMAGRGTDIKLGEGVADLGGLFVLGTERHESCLLYTSGFPRRKGYSEAAPGSGAPALRAEARPVWKRCGRLWPLLDIYKRQEITPPSQSANRTPGARIHPSLQRALP